MGQPSHLLNDEQINALLDGVADDEIVDRATCDQSAAPRLAAWQRWDEQLRAQLWRWDCPTAQQLADYHWSIGERQSAQTIARHLETCVRCADEIVTLRTFLDTDPAPQMNSSLSRPPPARTTRLRSWVATVLPRTPALAVRGDDRSEIVAEAGDVTLVVEVEPADNNKVALAGQIATADPDRWIGALVEVRQDSVVHVTATVDDVASFRCAPLPPMPGELRITAADGTSVVLPQIEFSP